MIIGLIIVFGAFVGTICYKFFGSQSTLVWKIISGIAGVVIGSSVMAAAYVLNFISRQEAISFNWYSVAMGVVGICVVVYTVFVGKAQNVAVFRVVKRSHI